MKSMVRQIYIKVLATLLMSIFLTPIIGHTVYAHETTSNSFIKFGSVRKQMIVGEKQSLSTLLTFDNKIIGKSNKEVQYKSNNSTVIGIENDEIIAKSKGIATITAYYENKECSVDVRVYDTHDFKVLKEKQLKVELKWKREKDKVSLNWTKFDEFIGFRILRKEMNQNDYTEIVKDGVGNSFLDEDILPNREYFYKIFLKDKKNNEFMLNELKIHVYNPTKESAEESILENKPKVIFEIQNNELKILSKEINNLPSLDNKEILLLDGEEKPKEETKIEKSENREVLSQKDKEVLIDIPGSWETLKVKKEEILEGSQKKLKLSYYYDNQLDINENNLVIYNIDSNGNISEVPGVTIDTKNKIISFITDKEGNYCFEIKVDEKNELKSIENFSEENKFEDEVIKENLNKDTSIHDNTEVKEKDIQPKEDNKNADKNIKENIISEPNISKKSEEEKTLEDSSELVEKNEEIKLVNKQVSDTEAKEKPIQPKEDKKDTDKNITENIILESKVSKNSEEEKTLEENSDIVEKSEEIKLVNKQVSDTEAKEKPIQPKEDKKDTDKNITENIILESKVSKNSVEEKTLEDSSKLVEKNEEIKLVNKQVSDTEAKEKPIQPKEDKKDTDKNITENIISEPKVSKDSEEEKTLEELLELFEKKEQSLTTEAPVVKRRRKRSLNIDEYSVDAKMATDSTVYTGPGSSNYAVAGSVDANEEIRAIGSEWGWIYITYRIGNTNTFKRGYVITNQLQNAERVYDNLHEMYFSGYADAARTNVTVLTGPDSSKYAQVGSIYAGEGITVFNKIENGYSYIEFSTPKGAKRGYIKLSDLRGSTRGTLATVTSTTTVYGSPGANAAKIGSIYDNELVVILDQNNIWYYIEYNTSKGRKRGYCFKNTFKLRSDLRSGIIRRKISVGESTANLTVYSGPNKNYATMGSINYKEKVALLNENEYGYTNIEYGTKVGLKRGFVPYGTIKKVSNISLPSIEANSKVTKGIYGYSGKGRELAYYKIGNGSKALVSVFAIHGFEDAWASDGLELYKIAADTIKDLSNINDLNGWTAYIIPTANPDGIIEGFTNDGPGRGTVSDQMDLNRSFPKNYVAYTEGSRNYNGNRSLVAPEASSLNNFIHNKKSEHSNMVLLDVHGWENKTIGNSEIGAYFGEQFGFGHIEKYPGGFLIAEGNAIGAKSTLVELPMPNSPSDIVNRGFSQKISRAIQNIIIRNPENSTNAVDSTKVTPVDAKQGKVVKVTSYLNIRSGAGTNYGIVGTLKPDQIVDLYGEVGNWYKIYLGYVSKDFIEKLKETPKPDSKPKEETTISKQGQVVNVTSHLNIRSGAGKEFDIVGNLKPDQIVDLYGKTNKWYKIYLGYVHEDFIKELSNVNENHVKEESKKPIIEENTNQGEEVTVITITTSFLKGVGEGVYEDIKSLFDIHAIIESISNVPGGVEFLVKAAIGGTEENKIFNQVLENMINDFLDSNGNEKAKSIGKIVGKLALAIIGTKGLDKGKDLIKLSAKSGKLSALASRISKGGKLENVDEILIEIGETGGLSGPACFTENTLIYTKDGYTPIKEIKIGDKVYSKNVYTNEVGLKEVKNTYVKEKSKLVYITIANDIIETTEEHPFYVKDKGWVLAGNLTKDDKLVTDNKEANIDKIETKALDKPVKVYNFEVEDWHNYFVSENKVLVHNSCSEITKRVTEAGKLKSIGNGVWESTEGLIYDQGSKQGNRVLHVLEHASPDPTKPLHSVFNVSKDKVLGVVDEAWSMRSGVTPTLQKNGNQVFNIPMGKVVGTNGETLIRIVVKNGTSEVVTAFPVK